MTSKYSGSPGPPGSFVRSRTASVLTVFGRPARKCWIENGRYSRTLSSPTFSPCAVSASTASCAVSAPEPISSTTRSASGAPSYWNSSYFRPTTRSKRRIAFSTHAGQAS